MGVGLMANLGILTQNAKRNMAAINARGGESSIERYGKKDHRIDRMLGAFRAFRMISQNASELDLCIVFKLTPSQACELREMTSEMTEMGQSAIKVNTGTARMIYLRDKTAFTPRYWDLIAADSASSRPRALTEKVEFLGRLAYKVTQHFSGIRTSL